MSEQLKVSNDIGKIESDEIHSDEITGQTDVSEAYGEAFAIAEAREAARVAAEVAKSNSSTTDSPELTDDNSIDSITTSERSFTDAMYEGTYDNALELSKSEKSADIVGQGAYDNAINLSQKAVKKNEVEPSTSSDRYEAAGDTSEFDKNKNIRTKMGEFALDKIRLKTKEMAGFVENIAKDEKDFFFSRIEEVNQKIYEVKQLKKESEARINTHIENAKGTLAEKTNRLKESKNSFGKKFVGFYKKLLLAKKAAQQAAKREFNRT